MIIRLMFAPVNVIKIWSQYAIYHHGNTERQMSLPPSMIQNGKKIPYP